MGGYAPPQLNATQLAAYAIEDARNICMRRYGSAPEVEVYADENFTFAYVPEHLHHMLFELVKNSLRAVQVHFTPPHSTRTPPHRAHRHARRKTPRRGRLELASGVGGTRQLS